MIERPLLGMWTVLDVWRLSLVDCWLRVCVRSGSCSPFWIGDGNGHEEKVSVPEQLIYILVLVVVIVKKGR